MKQGRARAHSVASNGDVYDIAAEWHTRLEDEDLSAAARAELDVWLAGDSRHREAFEAVDRTWMLLRAARSEPQIAALRRTAMRSSRRAVSLRRVAACAVCLAMIGVVGALAMPILSNVRTAALSSAAAERIESGSLRTTVGESAKITLSDGSAVVLNTSSHVDIRYTHEERRVHLVSGQAWFRVAKNPARPFVVEAGNQRVTALGTAFDVRIDEQQDVVQVALAEGRVSVEPIRLPLLGLLAPKVAPEQLAPGEMLLASHDAPVSKRNIDVDQIGTWREGEVVFDDTTLEAAVAELNRYSSKKIELADPALGAHRVSGVFKTGNSRSFIETVTAHYPLEVIERDGHVVLRAAAR